MIDELVKELKKMVSFKETTLQGDIVLIAIEKPQSVVYALVSDIERDEGKKEEWFHVGLHLLSVPPQKVTWTLRVPHFTGQEIFTMGDEGRFIKAIRLEPSEGAGHPMKKEPQKKNNPPKTALRLVK